MYSRSNTKVVHIGGVSIGGGHPIAIQSMTNTDTRDIDTTVSQILALEAAGCEIVRVAVPDTEAAEAISEIKNRINLPLVADIHFDHRLAILSTKNGADKLRINPGNIGSESNVREVAEVAKANGIPIRVGVNSGSLEKDLLTKYGGVTGEGLAQSALINVAMLEKHGFTDIVVSVKATNVQLMLAAHEILTKKIPYPLHVGLTESGTVINGAIRSAAGMGALLNTGVGDTLRVSLAGDPVEEINAAKQILIALGLRQFGPVVIACPMCGRSGIDVTKLAERIEKRVEHVKKPMTIAVMGCAVNGPGEAREADLGIAGGKGEAVLFVKGEIIGKVAENEIEDALLDKINGGI